MDELQFCPQCGHAITVRGAFCGRCGGRIQAELPVRTPASQVAPPARQSVRARTTYQFSAPEPVPAVPAPQPAAHVPAEAAPTVSAAAPPVNVTISLPAGMNSSEIGLWARCAALPLLVWAGLSLALSLLVSNALNSNHDWHAVAQYAGKDILGSALGIIGGLLAGFGFQANATGSLGVSGLSTSVGWASLDMWAVPLGSVLLFSALLGVRMKRETEAFPVKSSSEAALRVAAGAAFTAIPMWFIVNSLATTAVASYEQAIQGTSISAAVKFDGGPDPSGLLVLLAALLVGGAIGLLAASPDTLAEVSDRFGARAGAAQAAVAGAVGYSMALASATVVGLVIAVGWAFVAGLDLGVLIQLLPAFLAIAPTAIALAIALATGAGFDATTTSSSASQSYCVPFNGQQTCYFPHQPSFWDQGPVVVVLCLGLLALPGLLSGLMLARNSRPRNFDIALAGLVAAAVLVGTAVVGAPRITGASGSVIGSSSASDSSLGLTFDLMRVVLVSAVVSVLAAFGGVRLYFAVEARASEQGLRAETLVLREVKGLRARFAALAAAQPSAGSARNAAPERTSAPARVATPVRPAAQQAPLGPVLLPDAERCPWCAAPKLAGRPFCVACGARLAA
jgi:hypothetical protein